MSKLKPCPFCGRKAELHYYEIDEPFTFTECGYEIYCCHCGIRFKERLNRIPQFDEKADIKKQNLIERWNRRVNDGVESNEADRPQGEWIPCSERLPDEKGEYLVTYHPCYWDDVRTDIRVGIDSFRGKTTWAKHKHQRVIAWMPLPEPYKGGDTE